MSQVKIIDIIRCSSEDPQYPVLNLLKSTAQKWLSSKYDKSENVIAELQLEKAVVISFIDIGNYGSHTTDIHVSHSLRANGEFLCLVPSFTFMSVQESKQGINKTKVQMFTQDNMMAGVKGQKWDRIKIVCRQPYGNSGQFGLSFLGIRACSSSTGEEQMEKTVQKPDSNNNQSKLNNFFGHLVKSPARPALKLKSSQSPKFEKHETFLSPTQNIPRTPKTPKRVFSPAAQAEFAEEVSCFLEDINFVEMIQDTQVKVSDLREQMEKQRGSSLRNQQKRLFMEIIADKVNEDKRKKALANKQSATKSPQQVEKTSSTKVDENDDVVCSNCNIRLPSHIISIHMEICNQKDSKKSKLRNRNSLCFDMHSSSDEEDSLTPKRKRIHSNIEEQSCGNTRTRTNDTTSQETQGGMFRNSPPKANTNKSPSLNSTKNRESPLLAPSPARLSCTPTHPAGTIKVTGTHRLQAVHRPKSRGGTSISSYKNATGSMLQKHTSPSPISCSPIPRSTTTSTWLSAASPMSAGQEWVAQKTAPLPICIDDHDYTPNDTHVNGAVSKRRRSTPNASPSAPFRTKTITINEIEPINQHKSSASFNKSKTPCAKNPGFKPVESTVGKYQPKTFTWDDPKSGITLSGMSKAYTTLPQVNSAMQECPICHDQISKYEIGIHASLCDGVSASKSVTENTVTPQPAEMVECPLCGTFLEKDVINVHVNHCLDAS